MKRRPTEQQLREVEWMAKHGASARLIKAQTGISYEEYRKERADQEELAELRSRQKYGRGPNCGPWGDGE